MDTPLDYPVDTPCAAAAMIDVAYGAVISMERFLWILHWIIRWILHGSQILWIAVGAERRAWSMERISSYKVVDHGYGAPLIHVDGCPDWSVSKVCCKR